MKNCKLNICTCKEFQEGDICVCPYYKESNTPKIYIASKTRHADKWVALRESGVNIVSTWIDEAGEGSSIDLADLCDRCINESKQCDAMIVYGEDGDYLKGAFIEMGIALANNIPVF